MFCSKNMASSRETMRHYSTQWGGFGWNIPGSNTQENSLRHASKEETEVMARSEKLHQWAHGGKSKGKGTKSERLEETQPGPYQYYRECWSRKRRGQKKDRWANDR